MGTWKTREPGWPGNWRWPPPAQGVALTVNRVGSMLTLFFTAGPVGTLTEAKKSDLTQFQKFFQGMLEAGISLPPSQFEALFISRAHTLEDLKYTVGAAERVWSRWQEGFVRKIIRPVFKTPGAELATNFPLHKRGFWAQAICLHHLIPTCGHTGNLSSLRKSPHLSF